MASRVEMQGVLDNSMDHSVSINQEQSFLKKLAYLDTAELRDSLLWYFGKTKPIFTTPGVIAEIHRLAQKYINEQQDLGRFWKFAKGKLIELGIQEELVKLLELNDEELQKFYPVDSSLIELARRCIAKGQEQPILVADSKLCGHCRKTQVPFLWFHSVLGIRIDYESM